jgi:hypothetical protein
MSETKTPKPGEWWLRNSGGRIFYISGFNPEGWVVHWNEDVGFFSSKMRFFCKDFRHEPRCTGFGWVEPPEDPNDIPLNPVPGKVVATGTVTLTPVTPPDDMAAIIAEHTQQVRELTQRIGELAQRVNERDGVIEQIRTALHQGYFL